MNIEKEISRQANKPLPRQFILSLLNGYSQPNDKVHALIKRWHTNPAKERSLHCRRCIAYNQTV